MQSNRSFQNPLDANDDTKNPLHLAQQQNQQRSRNYTQRKQQKIFMSQDQVTIPRYGGVRSSKGSAAANNGNSQQAQLVDSQRKFNLLNT